MAVPPFPLVVATGLLRRVARRSEEGCEANVHRRARRRRIDAFVESATLDLAMPASEAINIELTGGGFPLDGRPLLANAEHIPMPDGSYGMFVDQGPLQQTMDRWIAKDFDGMEHAFAAFWREHLASIDREAILKMTKGLRKRREPYSQAEVAAIVLRRLTPPFWEHQLRLWCGLVGLRGRRAEDAVSWWLACGAPDPKHYAPYTRFVTFVRLYFHIAVALGVINTRASNKIDIEYFEFLPFVRAFTSADRIHAENFDVLAPPYCTFLSLAELRPALNEMADYYDNLPYDIRRHGTYTYADMPPVHMDNAVTCVFDRVFPDLREGANQPRPPRDPAEEARIMEQLRPMMEAIEQHRKGKGR